MGKLKTKVALGSKAEWTTLLATDPCLEAAVYRIEQNCGPDTRALLTNHPKMPPKEILTLSKTSTEYQLHVLENIRAGHADPLKKTATAALLYETVRFYEIISRLNRALGQVRCEVSFITSQIAADAPELDRGSDRLLSLALIIESAENIANLVHGLPTLPPLTPEKEPEQKNLRSDRIVSSKLMAAGGLGFLAKNVRNLPLLKSEHHPTETQQKEAIDLCKTITGIAEPALQSARQQWGRLDASVWLRSPKSSRRIITHADPDGDAIASAWLAERFLFGDEKVDILFVPRERVLGCLRPGDCLVDVGNTSDPLRYLYDHEPPALSSRHDSCAAKLVWDHLLILGKPVRHLENLVLAVFDWDSGKRRKEVKEEAVASKRAGFHAALNAAKQRGLNNVALYRHMRRRLDKISATSTL